MVMVYPPTLGIWLWRAIRSKLPTKDKLIKPGIPSNTTCSIYQSQEENLNHILLHCPKIKPLWAKYFPQIQVSNNLNDVCELYGSTCGRCRVKQSSFTLPNLDGLFGFLEIL